MLGTCSFVQTLGVAGGSGGVCSEPSIDWTTVVIQTAGGDVANLVRSLFLFLGRLLSHLCNDDALSEL